MLHTPVVWNCTNEHSPEIFSVLVSGRLDIALVLCRSSIARYSVQSIALTFIVSWMLMTALDDVVWMVWQVFYSIIGCIWPFEAKIGRCIKKPVSLLFYTSWKNSNNCKLKRSFCKMFSHVVTNVKWMFFTNGWNIFNSEPGLGVMAYSFSCLFVEVCVSFHRRLLVIEESYLNIGLHSTCNYQPSLVQLLWKLVWTSICTPLVE